VISEVDALQAQPVAASVKQGLDSEFGYNMGTGQMVFYKT
jgi:hypothetical protein